MATQSNTRNSGNTFFTINIQRVTRTATTETLRVRVRLTSPNVIDSNNDFRITGGWSFRGTVALSGAYSNDLVWTSGNITVDRPGPTSDAVVTRTARLRWNGVEYWGGELDATDEYTIERQAPVKPSAPGAPTFSNITTQAAKVSWGAPSSNGGAAITTYQVALAYNSSFTNQWTTTSMGTTRSYTTGNRGSNETSWVRVRAQNSVGWSPWSAAKSFTTLMALPSAPSAAPTISSISSSQMTVTSAATLNAGGGTILEYQAQRATNNTFTANAVAMTLNSSRAGVFSGLPRATTFYVRTRCRNQAGWGAWSATSTTSTLPAAPVLSNGATHHSVTRSSASVYGTPISDNGGQSPTNHRVQFNTSASESGASLSTAGSWVQVTLTGLSDATTYYYRRSAANAAGWGPWTTWQSFKTLAGGADDMDAPYISAITEDSAVATWTIPALGGSTFSYLRLEWSTTPTFASKSSEMLFTQETTHVLTNLTPGTSHYFRIQLVTTGELGGTGPWSSAMFTTAGDPPAPGLRMFTFIAGQRREGELYTFVDGVREKLAVNAAVDGEMVP